jgi:hypothetical protein
VRREREESGSLAEPRSFFLAGQQRYIDVFEDLTGSDAKNAVGGFDQIVALASGVLTAEDVGEGEAGGELLGFDQKPGAICGPWICGFHACRLSVVGSQLSVLSSQFSVLDD